MIAELGTLGAIRGTGKNQELSLAMLSWRGLYFNIQGEASLGSCNYKSGTWGRGPGWRYKFGNP